MSNGQNKFISVSGQPTFEKQRIPFPSGVFGVEAFAELNNFNATFGFNTSPHTFELEYIPSDPDPARAFQEDAIVPVGSGVTFNAGGSFFIKGRIKHFDYSTSIRGNVLSITIEDLRKDLDEFYLDTYGLFGANDAPRINVVDVRYWFVQTRINTITGSDEEREVGRSRAFRDLNQLETHGASYRQIYEAVRFFEEQEGTVFGLLSKIPRPEIIDSQLEFSVDAYRWKFRAQPFLQAMSRILNDVSYDFYYNMVEDRIDVVNRRFPVNIDKDNLPVTGDDAAQISLRFGRDEGERPTTVTLLGAEMEGLVGCGFLKEESGAYNMTVGSGIAPSGFNPTKIEYDLGIAVCSTSGTERILEFVPGWRDATIKYFGPDGSEREYSPSDRILAASIKGVEYWAREVDLDNRIEKFTIDPDTGETVAQFSLTAPSGKLGEIPNRGQPGRSWILEWYNRTRNFAQNHYSRTYILAKDQPLYDFIDEIEVPNESWTNIENQTEDGSFEDNYKISDQFKFLAPFWNAETNKLKPFCVLNNAKWGTDGQGVPAQFNDWNETGTIQIVPIEVKKWNRADDKFKENFIAPLRTDEKGIMIRLPALCWGIDSRDNPDSALSNIPTLLNLRENFLGKTTFDFQDPLTLLKPFPVITGATVPVRVKRRYGFKFPQVWASGTGVKRELQIREDLAPWNFEPRGVQESWELMNDEALATMRSRVVERNFVTFAESTKVGLPIISFDTFAEQMEQPEGYGIVNHGVTNLSVTKDLNNFWQTKYSLKSHFGQLVKAKPVFDGPDEDFAFVIKRLESDIAARVPPDIFQPPESFEIRTDDERQIFQDTILEKFQVPVTITAVFDRGIDEFYKGVDDRGITWPRVLDTGFSLSPDSIAFQNRKAFAVDGFLQVGMRATYNFEELEDGGFVHYFTGGVSLGDARVVELRPDAAGNVVRTVGGLFVANARTLETPVVNPETGQKQLVAPFSYFNVPFLAQNAVDQSQQVNQKIVMTSHGNKNNKDIPPDGNFGPGGDNVNDAFLVNSGAPGDTDFGNVTTAPNVTTGEGGAVQSVTSLGGETFTDGENDINVRFVGAEFSSIRVDDFCIIKQVRLTDGSTNVFCFIVKPKFVPTNAFNA